MADHKIVDEVSLAAIASDIKAAIAEKANKYTDITGTLSVGQTSITLSNAAITENSTIDYYTNYFGINPVGVNVSNGRVVLTFEEQDVDISVKVRVS